MKTRFLGFGVPYETGMALMRETIANIDTDGPQLLLLEHEDVVTITRQHGHQNLLTSEQELVLDGIKLIETDRGGDVTFHGKGQLVGYPILKLPPSMGPLNYVRSLETALAHVCIKLGIRNTHCMPGKTGIWVNNHKLIAIGVGLSRGVTRHGFALNISTNLERFTRHIVPCGLTGYGVTSLVRELDEVPSFEYIASVVAEELASWPIKL